MSILKKALSFIIVFIFLLHTIQSNAYGLQNSNKQTPVNVAVFLLDNTEPFLSNLMEELGNVQKLNKVQFTFFDSKRNQETQNENIVKALNNEDFDLFVVEPVTFNLDQLENTFNKILQKNIPFILLTSPNRQLSNLIRKYPKSLIIGTDNSQAGTLEGKILSDTWNANKEILDKNKDNIMQYIILNGPADDPATPERNKSSVQAIKDAGIQTQELASQFCNWDKECAKTSIDSLFLRYGGNNIESIISGNDAMAIGAIQTLQKYGYNKGDPSKYIPVVGIDGIPEATALIKNGFMTGTVVQNPHDYANAIYIVGINLISGSNPLNGTNYKFDDTGNTIRIPNFIYTG